MNSTFELSNVMRSPSTTYEGFMSQKLENLAHEKLCLTTELVR